MSAYQHLELAAMAEPQLLELLDHLDNQIVIVDFQIREEEDPQIKVRLMRQKREFGSRVDQVLDQLEERNRARILPMH